MLGCFFSSSTQLLFGSFLPELCMLARTFYHLDRSENPASPERRVFMEKCELNVNIWA